MKTQLMIKLTYKKLLWKILLPDTLFNVITEYTSLLWIWLERYVLFIDLGKHESK